jgi:hypothetical protein
MPRKVRLSADDYVVLQEVLAQVRRDIQVQGRRNPTVDAEAVLGRVPRRLRWRAELWCLRQGRIALVQHLDRRQICLVPDAATDQPRKFQAWIGQQQRAAGGQVGLWEREEWWRTSTEEFNRWAESRIQAAGRLNLQVRQIRSIQKILTDFPAVMVADSFKAAGKDPRHFKLS